MRSSRLAALAVNDTSPSTFGTSGQSSAEWVSNSAVLETQDSWTKPPLSLWPAFSVSSIVRLPSKQRQARSTFFVRENTKEKLSPLAGISLIIQVVISVAARMHRPPVNRTLTSSKTGIADFFKIGTTLFSASEKIFASTVARRGRTAYSKSFIVISFLLYEAQPDHKRPAEVRSNCVCLDVDRLI